MFLQLKAFERPGDLVEALRLLARPGYRALAGGTAAVGPVDSETVGVVDLSQLDLKFQRMESDGLVLGALTTLGELLNLPELLLAGGTVLGQAVERTGPPSLLARATLGGSLARPDLAPELVTALIALDAHVLLVRLDATGGHLIREDWELDSYLAWNKAGTLIEAVRIPARPVAAAYERVARTPRDLATVAVIATLEEDGEFVHHVRIAAWGVAPTPVRLTAAEEVLENTAPIQAVIERAAEAAAAAVTPEGDLRGSAEYRKHLTAVLTRRAVEAAASRLGRM
ncbi:MAG TPA: FAD binding domain-containing protein [Symbiobacteriaceae bacterium]|nr:FAD binding domain-containing protein [Symbiobacteriaceae bacterium]